MAVFTVRNSSFKSFYHHRTVSILGEEVGFLSQAVLPALDDDGANSGIGATDPLNQSLVAAPSKVEKLLIGYAKQAKKMDMRKLKAIEWHTLQQLSKIADPEDKENNDENVGEKEKAAATLLENDGDGTKRMKCGTVVDFANLYSKLYDPRSQMTTKMKENLSVPLAFVALLHLCNEQNLALESVADFSDFKIQQG